MNVDIFIAAAAGYWFLSRTYRSKARIERRSGYQLLFESLIAGVGLWLISWTVAALVKLQFRSAFCFFKEGAEQVLPFLEPTQVLASGIVVVIALFVPLILNACTDKEALASKLVEKEGNLLEWTAQEALGRASLLELTLSSGKTYVGFVLDRWAVTGGNASIAIVPVLSGFRDKATQELRITTNYAPLLRRIEGKDLGSSTDIEDEFAHLSVKDMQVVVPSREIISARLFDLKAYRFLESDPWQQTPEAEESAEDSE